jgi:hypothetical protein
MRSAGLPIVFVAGTALGAVAACAKAQFESMDAAPLPVGDAPAAKDLPQEPRVCPAPSIPACTEQWSPCDPVCQTGTCDDWCGQKCSFAYDQDLRPQIACVADNGGKHVFPEGCKVEHPGTGQQTDDCSPGHICLPAFKGGELTLCFKLCHDKTECIFGECASRVLSSAGGTVNVCDPPYTQCGDAPKPCCDPLNNTGCESNQYCFLVPPGADSNHSRTLCDYSYGNGRRGSTCTSSRDCQQLHTCVDGFCKEVCAATSACPSGACSMLGAEYGYCP